MLPIRLWHRTVTTRGRIGQPEEIAHGTALENRRQGGDEVGA